MNQPAAAAYSISLHSSKPQPTQELEGGGDPLRRVGDVVDEVLEDLGGALQARSLQSVVLVPRLQEGVRVVPEQQLGRLKSAKITKVVFIFTSGAIATTKSMDHIWSPCVGFNVLTLVVI